MSKPKSLLVLDSLKIESPCQESWELMKGTDIQRHCQRCNHSVHNLSEMTSEEAVYLLNNTPAGKRVCVRYRKEKNGSIQFRKTVNKSTNFLWRAALIVLGIITGLRMSQTAYAEKFTQGDVALPQTHPQIMGEIQVSPPHQSGSPTPTPSPSAEDSVLGQVVPPQKEK